MGSVAVVLKPSLFEITGTLIQLFDILEQSESLEEKTATEVEIRRVIETELAQKVDGIAYFDRCIDAEVVKLQDLIRCVETKIGVLYNRRARVRNVAKMAMRTLGTKKLQGDIHTITIRDGSESVDVRDEEQIPHTYFNRKETFTLDKNRVKADLKAGKEIPGVSLKIGDDVLTIR